MATRRAFRCGEHGPTAARATLFECLARVAAHDTPRCSVCAGPLCLELEFEFGLGAPDKRAAVVGSFLPKVPEAWRDRNGASVTFYPFLVVVERYGRERATWLPYWHVIEHEGRRQTKYGQWAPFMDRHLFEDLVAQAVRAGMLSVP